MQTIYRTIFSVAFMVHADRDKFQAIANAYVRNAFAAGTYRSRVLTGPDITTDTEIGYEWFDAVTRDAVWAARIVVGFLDPAERDAFSSAIFTDLGRKDATYSYYTDAVGKVGAVSTDLRVAVEPGDSSQVMVT